MNININNNDENVHSNEMEQTKESFSKSLFYIQLVSLVLAILSFFLIK